MRMMVVTAIVALLCLAGIGFPEVGFLGYIWFGQMRPDLMAYSSVNRLALILAVCTLLGSMRRWADLPRVLVNPFVLGFLLLHVFLGISVIMTSYMDLVIPKYLEFIQMSVIVVLAPLLIDSIRKVRWLLLTLGGALGGVGLKYGLWGILQGGARFNWGVGGFHSDNNTMALGLCLGLPFCYYAVHWVSHFPVKVFFWFMCLMMIATIFMTHSRGGILTLGVQALYVFWKSKHRVALALVFLLACAPLFLLVSTTLVERMSTMSAPLEESSALARYQLSIAALRMLQDYWVVGIGFGTLAFQERVASYNSLVGNAQVAHNNWLQMIVDSGIGSLAAFCALLFGALWWARKTAAAYEKNDPGRAAIGHALICSLIGFIVGSTFLSRTNYDLIYFIILSVGAWYGVEQMEKQASGVETAGLPGAPTEPPAGDPLLAGGPRLPAPPHRPRGLGRALRSAGEGRGRG